MLYLRTEGPYGSGLQVKKLGRDETIHESKGQHSVPHLVYLYSSRSLLVTARFLNPIVKIIGLVTFLLLR